jgi:hypothetical protein
LCSVGSAVVVLVNLVDGEVLGVNVGLELGLERCADASQTIPRDTAEKWMLPDLAGTTDVAETMVGIANQARKKMLARYQSKWGKEDSPPHKVLGLCTKLLIGREVQVARPIHNLTVSIMGLLCAERWPTDQAFKHDGANRPPIATKVVALATEDLWRDVVGCTDSGVGQLTTRLPPCVDLCAVANCQLDLVHVHRVTVVAIRLVGAASKQLLVVAGIVLLVETC